MRDWLLIQHEKEIDPSLTSFIQANPLLDRTMRTMLANYLNLSERRVENWIQEYHNETGEC